MAKLYDNIDQERLQQEADETLLHYGMRRAVQC